MVYVRMPVYHYCGSSRHSKSFYSRRTVIVLLILAALASTCLYHAVGPPEVEVVFSVGQGTQYSFKPKSKTVLVDSGGLRAAAGSGEDIILPPPRKRDRLHRCRSRNPSPHTSPLPDRLMPRWYAHQAETPRTHGT